MSRAVCNQQTFTGVLHLKSDDDELLHEQEVFHFAVDLTNITANASKGLVGAALEDINFSIYPGLYSSVIFGEGFEEDHIQGITNPKGPKGLSWAGCATDPACHATWAVPAVGYSNRSTTEITTERPHTGKQALSLHCLAAPCEYVGVSNMGLHRWGLALSGGLPLEGRLFLRGNASLTVSLCPSHTDREPLPTVDACCATVTLDAASADWSQRTFRLIPSKNDTNGSFVLRLGSGANTILAVDDVLLEPSAEQRWRGQHVRKDMADAMLLDGGLGFVRFGGDMADAPSYE